MLNLWFFCRKKSEYDFFKIRKINFLVNDIQKISFFVFKVFHGIRLNFENKRCQFMATMKKENLKIVIRLKMF